MPSRRKLKKQIKERTDLLIEDAFIESINGDDKEGKKMDSLIDSIIDDRYEMLTKISNYPINGKRAEVKAHFSEVNKALNSKVDDYTKKVGRVG